MMLLGYALIQFNCVLLIRGNLDKETPGVDRPSEDTEGRLRREASEEDNPAETLILDF